MAMDVAVIGAGIFGLTAAWSLSEQGARVRVFEAGRVGAGSSGGVVGALSPHMPDAWNPKKAFQLRALLKAGAFWGDVAQASGVDTGYGRVGRILPLHSEKAAALARGRAKTAVSLWQGEATFEVLEAAHGVSAAHGVVLESLSARLYPARAVAGLATALRMRGVEIVEQSPVDDPMALPADCVVVAAGHQTGRLLPDLAPLLRGVKGQAALLDHVLPGDMPVLFDDGLYVIGHGAHGTAIGSTSENTWDGDGPDQLLDGLIARAKAILPQLGGANVVQRWAGIRPRAARPDPVFGQFAPGVWVFSGGFKIGFGIAHELADALVAEMLGDPVDVPQTFRLSDHLA